MRTTECGRPELILTADLMTAGPVPRLNLRSSVHYVQWRPARTCTPACPAGPPGRSSGRSCNFPAQQGETVHSLHPIRTSSVYYIPVCIYRLYIFSCVATLHVILFFFSFYVSSFILYQPNLIQTIKPSLTKSTLNKTLSNLKGFEILKSAAQLLYGPVLVYALSMYPNPSIQL